jgi:hypothetical protein
VSEFAGKGFSEANINKFEKLIRLAQKFSKKNPELNQIYLDLASQGLFHLSQKLSRQVEGITAYISTGR